MPEHNVWQSWAVSYRDIYILDSNNALSAIFNVSSHSLEVPDHYNHVLELIDAASD